MRYERIDMTGERAGATASITRGEDRGRVHIAIRLPGGGTEEGQQRAADLTSPDERWRAAAWVQQALDGFRGSGGDVREVAHALDLVGGV